MKKKLLLMLSILLLSSALTGASAKSNSKSELTDAIKMYKNGNYTQCYATLNEFVKTSPDNALAYYYLAMSATQIGRSEEATTNYEKVLTLSPENTALYKYAVKGKVCIESPDSCREESSSEFEEFINDKFKAKLSPEVKSDFERLKIENMMREMNRSKDISPRKFREFRDFSSMNNDATPTNDEIVAAIRVLQKAGIGNYADNNLSALSLLSNTQDAQNPMYNMLNANNMNPQMIQALFANSMSLGF